MSDLRPGDTCWRTGRAGRVAFLIDSQAYFAALHAALLNARRSILLLGWAMDPRTRLLPDGSLDSGHPDEIGALLLRLSKERPDLDIHLLIWKSALPVSLTQEFFPHRARAWFHKSRIRFDLDDTVPLGACHHQKVVVIDDQVAFTGGGDVCSDRWDSEQHLDTDIRRRMAHHAGHDPRHEVMVMVDGEAARIMGDLARERWKRSLGETLPPPPVDPDHDVWPQRIKPDLRDVFTGLGRTLPAWRKEKGVREIQALQIASIKSAKKLIYLENQYFTSPLIAEALASRLAEPHGPDVVLVSTFASPSWFDRLTMDRVRGIAIRRLQEADVFGRFRAFSPFTAGGHPIIVHSKVSIFDDAMARVGSANLNNRSTGFDTECELAMAAETPAHRRAIADFRHHLIGHYLATPTPEVTRSVAASRTLTGAIDMMNRAGRLRPIAPRKLTRLERVIADFHLGDPMSPKDAMRPYLRRRRIDRRVHDIAADGGMRRFIEQLRSRISGEDDPTPGG